MMKVQKPDRALNTTTIAICKAILLNSTNFPISEQKLLYDRLEDYYHEVHSNLQVKVQLLGSLHTSSITSIYERPTV